MPLYRQGAFQEDAWTYGGEHPQDFADNRALVVSKAVFLAHREALSGRNAPLGLQLLPGEDLSGLEEEEIHRFALMVLNFPKFNDGRLYSIARLLRERFGYKGEIRATGDILRDQLAFLYRAGVDSFLVTNDSTIEALRDKKLVASRHHYQRSSRCESSPANHPHAFESPVGAIPGASS